MAEEPKSIIVHSGISIDMRANVKSATDPRWTADALKIAIGRHKGDPGKPLPDQPVNRGTSWMNRK